MMAGCMAAVGAMGAGGGVILNIASISALTPVPGLAVYAASKAALHAYARVWLAELKDKRIRVNVLTPGQIVAAGQEQMFDDETKAAMDAREALIPVVRRADGSYIHDMYLVQVKEPKESKGTWDYYKIIKKLPAEQIWTTKAESKCQYWR